MENKFTQKAQNALILATAEAQNFGHTYIGSEHLLLGLIEEKDGVASKMLLKRGIIYTKIKNDIIAQTDKGAKTTLSSKNLSPRVRKIIENSYRLSEKNKQSLIGSEHLLYSLLSENDCLAVRVLEQNGLYIHEMQTDILNFIQSSSSNQKTEQKRKDDKGFDLDNFGRNLISYAKDGKIDPTLCREKETERVIRILSRRTKNNPCLIGEPGVGKTAVIEGLSQRIAEGKVPDLLKNKIIFALDIPSIIAGAKYRGEFEERMKNVMRECLKNPNIILFIDEIHTIIGAGSAEGAIDAANILKPALARGEIQIIGATTISEYRKHIERDSALERRFQPITVNEPSAEQTEQILAGLRQKYEEHHRVKITDEALKAAVELSQRYINDRFLPDKAIDLIDEAAARARIDNYSLLNTLQKIKSELNAIEKEKEDAILSGNFNLAKKLHARESSLESEASAIINQRKTTSQHIITVDYDDIANVLTDWTGIPVSRLMQDETQKLISLEQELKKMIVGQDDAIKLVAEAIRRGRIGLKQSDKPMGSFIFVGPTGVGKTELCISLAKILFGSKDALIRFDMSEYMEKHSVSKLIGAPPGYIGYGEGGLLTEKVRTNPYCIILFDEIEKAHPEIFNIMLQILDDGTLTDAQGRKINFKNTLIVMTSNLGSISSNASNSLGFFTVNDTVSLSRERNKKIKDSLEKTFKPEFLNRVDEIVIFNPLSRENLEKICDILLLSLKEKLAKLNIDIELDSSVYNKIIDSALNEKSGARKLQREIRRLIENPLASKVLSGEICKEDKVSVSFYNDNIEFIK